MSSSITPASAWWGSILEIAEERFPHAVAINLKGVYLGCKHALPHLLANPRGGVILNTSSNGGLIGRASDPPYNATKHAVIGLTRSLALRTRTSGYASMRSAPAQSTRP